MSALPRWFSVAVVAISWGAAAVPAQAAIRYVNAASPDDSGDGLSWAAAKKNLQSALVIANPGDQVWVAAGVYKPDQGGGQVPGNRSATFQLESGVAIYGGFAGTETLLSQRDIVSNPTILSGDLLGDDTPVACSQNSPDCDSFGGLCVNGLCIISANRGENSYHVVTGSGTDATAGLDGFTVTAGDADGTAPDDSGAGMYNLSGSPTVTNCRFEANSASVFGGGMYNHSNSPVVTNCSFIENASGEGGGVANVLNSSPVFTDCAFIANSSGRGGGMRNRHNCNPRLIGCLFARNRAEFSGGGMANGSPSSPFVANCRFIGNFAPDGEGGGISNLGSLNTATVTNCIFSGNSAFVGGAMENESASSAVTTNCTFSGNSASAVGGGISIQLSSPTMTNCVLWGNSDSGGMDESAQITGSGTPVVNYGIVQGGWSGAGSNNLDADPLFVDADGSDNVLGTEDDDLRLAAGSPAIDAGDNSALPADTADLDGDSDTAEQLPIDLGGNPRRADVTSVPDTGVGPAPVVDRGAYERAGNVAYVDASATGANNGSSWDNAYLHLQSALTFAAGNPEISEIWVADGTYMPDGGRTPAGGAHVNGTGSRSASFQLLNGVALYGGFSGTETLLSQRNVAANPTILSGDLTGDDVTVPCTQSSPDCNSFGGLCFSGSCIRPDNNDENSYHVVTADGTDATAILDGFAIAAGNANGPPSDFSGGGMNTGTGSPGIRSCVFRGNVASEGGGMYSGGGSPAISQCTFLGNDAALGGGMRSSANSSPALAGCHFTANVALDGGGFHSTNGSIAILWGCVFSRNVALNNGGGFVANGSTSVVNCIFSSNSAMTGGAMHNQGYSGTVTNCMFSGNSADTNGGAVANILSSTPAMRNCTFSGNVAVGSGGGIYNGSPGVNSPAIVNSVFWGNSDAGGTDESAQVHTDSGTPAVHYSIVQGAWTGDGGPTDLNADPLFVDANGLDNIVGTLDDDLRLSPTSPAIDAGSNAGVTPPFDLIDLAGATRIQDGDGDATATVDMGAFEFFPDCNNNGVLDSTDIATGTSQDCVSEGWPDNGVPDECDIADCSESRICLGGPNHGQPCNFGTECIAGVCAGLGCHDCNLNGVPDGCDLGSGFSNDVDEDFVPDECGFFTGGCIEPIPAQRYWTCPTNWLLSGQYPDDEDSAAGVHVTLSTGSVVVLDESVVIPNLWIQNGAELQMTTPNTSIDVDHTIRVEGIFTMASEKLIANTPPALIIGPGGRFQVEPSPSGGPSSTMTAAEIRVLDEACPVPPCLDGGVMDITDGVIVTATGDFIVDGSHSGDTVSFSASDGTVAGGRTPPVFKITGSPVATAGRLELTGAVIVDVDSSTAVEVGGDFANKLARPESFDWLGGAVTMTGTGAVFEAAATDLGAAVPISTAAYAMGAISIAAGADVAFEDRFDNDASGQPPCTEAVYVYTMSLGAGSSTAVNNCRVYYNVLAADPSAVVAYSGCGQLVQTAAPLCTIAASPTLAQLDSNAGAGVSLVDLRNNRYLAIRAPGSAGRSQAIRVNFVSLPPPWHEWNGTRMFVTAPTAVCETSGVGPGGNCGAAATFQLAGLSCDPGDAAYLDWSAIPGGVVYVAHPGIIPTSAAVTTEYEVQMIDSTCDPVVHSAYSTVKSVLGVKWGDVCGGFDPSGPYYVAPNGTVDVAVDVTAALNKFGNRPGAPIKARVDVEPCLADAKINITDVTRILDGFRNLPFPFTPGSGFGCTSSDPCAYSQGAVGTQ